MNSKLMKMAVAAGVAMSIGANFAQDAASPMDPIAEAAAAAVAQVAQSAAALPPATVQQVEQAEVAKNPPPTQEEMKNDAGVQTVIKMQDAGKFPEQDGRDKTAKEQVEYILKKNGIKISQNKDRIIQVVEVQMYTPDDPAKDPKFFLKRDQLGKLLILKMKGQIAASVGSVVSAEDKARLFGGEGTNSTISVTSKFESVAKWPLFGVTVIAQAESWNGKYFTMAAAAVWSKVLHRAAKATLLGEDLKVSAGKMTVDQWLDERDLALMCGPRQLVDPEGNRVFLGIAAREIGRGAATDMINREAAKTSAMSYLTFSLFADVEQRLAYNAAAQYSQNGEDEAADATDKMDLKLAQRVDERVIPGASEVKSVEVEHPLSGKKVYVSVYSLDNKSVAQARVMAEELIATRVATELANKRALGRLQGYRDQVNAAKANTSEYNKGRAEGNAAIQKKLAPKGRTVSPVNAPAANAPAPQSQKGTFSGEGTISNDF